MSSKENFRYAFCLTQSYAYAYAYAYAYLDAYVAHFTTFFCLVFCFDLVLMLASTETQA